MTSSESGPAPDVIEAIRSALLASGYRDAAGGLQAVALRPLAATGLVADVKRVLPQYSTGVEGPSTLILKCPKPGWVLSEACSYREVDGYVALRDLGTRASSKAPIMYGFTDLPSWGCLIVLEDLGSILFPTQLAGLSNSQVVAAITTIGGVHRASGAPSDNPVNLDSLADSPMVEFCHGVLSSYEGRWPATLAMNADRLLGNWNRILDILSSDFVGFTHGDYHAGNLAFGPEGKASMFDLQFSARANPAIDVARLLSTSIATAQRRLIEPQLMERYVATSAIDTFTLRSAAYRAALLWNLAMPLAIHVRTLAESLEEWPDSLPILDRCCAAISDQQNMAL